jgi:glycosyltransferase involved in cell wall biosynthesis
MKVSAVLITKNEEACIEKCLKSLENFDEIVVLDTGSTDKTGEIARKYTTKYFDNIYKWRDDFAEARNIAQALATTEWRFIIDSDEFLGEGSLEGIRNFIETTHCRTIDIPCFDEINKAKHYQPRLYRNAPDIFWKGRIHNYLSTVGETKIDDTVCVYYGYSKAHWDDPDRTLRILKKVVEENPNSIREWFYLAREYVYRGQWEEAIKNYKIYFTHAVWAPEIAEAYFQLSKCYWNSGKWSDAREAAMDAIGTNADFKEAITWLAYMSGPNNKERWLLFSETAEDNNTLFGAALNELESLHYDGYWSRNPDRRSKFYKIWENVGEWVGDSNVLDIGCGTAGVREFIKGNYSGFDFSKEAIKPWKPEGKGTLWVGNIYDPENYKGDYDVCIALDVLQRIKDKDFIKLIRRDMEFIFSVPSWQDTGHMRWYTEKSIRRRLGDFLDIQEVIRFNSAPGVWDKTAENSNDCVYLVRSRRK